MPGLGLALAACATGTPAPLPTVVLDARPGAAPAATRAPGGSVTASGVVMPAREYRLAFPVTERIARIAVDVGDTVVAGASLAELDDALVRAQIRQAEAAAAVAQANYDALAAGPTAAQLRQAQAALLAVRAAYSRTLESPAPADLEAARAALSAANASYKAAQEGPGAATTAAAAAALRTAEAAVRLAQGAYDRAFARNPAGIGADPAALALEKATNDYAAAKAIHDASAGPSDAAVVSAAYQRVAAARAVQDRLLAPASASDRELARAEVDAAQARLDEVKAGPRPEALAAVKAQIESATAALAGLKVQLQRYALIAPAKGVILRRAAQPGEIATAGAAVLTLADLDALRVETTDLSERDLPAIKLGQVVSVNFKALGQSAAGKVFGIAPQAERLGGDVVYRVTIELDTRPAGLRAGMSADVQFGR